MAFANFAEFLQMGKHGAYVWTAYTLVLTGLIAIHLITHIRYKRLQAQLAALKKEANTSS